MEPNSVLLTQELILDLNGILLTSEIWDGFGNPNTAIDDEAELRDRHPGLKDLWYETKKARIAAQAAEQKYQVLLKLVKVTDKF